MWGLCTAENVLLAVTLLILMYVSVNKQIIFLLLYILVMRWGLFCDWITERIFRRWSLLENLTIRRDGFSFGSINLLNNNNNIY